MTNEATSFWKFIGNYQIEIPIIQRDYAQGRLGKEYLRNNFLGNLKQALDHQLLEPALKLDFVYGSEDKGRLSPLDGQQRLTTLWLLHWYVALRAGKLEEASVKLRNFTYETRISSREFCRNLCIPQNFEEYDGNIGIVDFITSRTWFYSSWKQDPTIQSMLRMIGGTKINDKQGNDIIDGLEELFDANKESFESYWTALTSENAPIMFYYLNLKDFKLTDDLYIKMNARGKQLTSFENFKADFIGYIEEKAKEDDAWGRFLNTEKGIPIKLDTEWTDVFWRNHDANGDIDRIFFAFLNRYLLNCAIIYNDAKGTSKEWKLYGTESDDSSLRYDNGFSIYSSILSKPEFLENLSSLFERLSGVKEDVCAYLPKWFKKFDFIPKHTENTISTLTQTQRVVFFGICRYLESCTMFNGCHFRKWMRVVCNLSENTTINTVDAMIARLKLIDELSKHAEDIYEYLASEDLEMQSKASPEQLTEEIAKAKQILKPQEAQLPERPADWNDDKEWNWESAIIEAEGFAFFNGTIKFLFKDANSGDDWTCFTPKFANSKLIFSSDGLTLEYKREAKANRILLSYCDQWWEQIQSYTYHDKYIFGCSAQLWKDNILTRKGATDNTLLYANAIHHLLLGDSINTMLQLKDPDDYRNIAFDKLVNTNIIGWSQSQGRPDRYYIRWTHDGFCLYPSSEGVILTLNNRDSLLSKLLDEGKITLLHGERLDTKPYKMFWGWDIKFQYNKEDNEFPYLFQWQSWNWIDMYEENKRLCEDERLKTHDLTIDGSEIKDENDLVEKMDQCIDRYRNSKGNADQLN